MRSNQGITLAEVLIALVILTLGVLAAADMQLSALGTSSRAAVSQQLTKLASAELETQRQLATPRDQQGCLSGELTGYTCTTTVSPCSLGTSEFTCAAGVSSALAYSVRVVTTGPRASSFTLSTLIAAQGMK